MKLSKELPGFLEAPEQTEVVAEHDDGIEGVGRKSIELFDGQRPRILDAALPAQSYGQR